MGWRDATRPSDRSREDGDDGAAETPHASTVQPDAAERSVEHRFSTSATTAATSSSKGWRSQARMATSGEGEADDLLPKSRRKKDKKDKKRRRRSVANDEEDDDDDGGERQEPSADRGDGAADEAADGEGGKGPVPRKEVTLDDIRNAAFERNDSLDLVPRLPIPTWVQEYMDLRLLTVHRDDPELPASQSVLLQAQESLAAARELAMRAQMRIDGGRLGIAAARVEGQEPDPAVSFRSIPNEEAAFWLEPNAAITVTDEFSKYMESRVDVLGQLDTLGPPFLEGADGAQELEEADVAGRMRKVVCMRAVSQDLFVTPSLALERYDSVQLLHRDYFSTPKLHAHFVCATNVFRPERALLRDVSPFEPDERTWGFRGTDQLKRVITVSVAMFRFADHISFSAAINHLSVLLGHYTRYRLLVANLLPRRSRGYYASLESSLVQALAQARAALPSDVLDRLPSGNTAILSPGHHGDDAIQQETNEDEGAAPSSKSASSSKRSSKKDKKQRRKDNRKGDQDGPPAADQTAVAAPPVPHLPLGNSRQLLLAASAHAAAAEDVFALVDEEEQRQQIARFLALERDVQAVRRHRVLATEEERALLEGMWRAWSHILVERRDGGAASGDGNSAGGEDASNATAARRKALRSISRILFYLRKTDDESVDYREGDDVLLFTPGVSTLDDAGDDDDDGEDGTGAAGPQHHGPSAETAMSLPKHVVANIYARSSSTGQTEFVGRSEPMRVDSAYSVSFNEVLELHTTHDPETIEVRVTDYPQGRVVATFVVPPSLSSTTHILESTVYGDPKSTAQLTLSTSWTTSTGLPFEAVEDLFLRGEADPLDPKNAALVLELRRRYATKGSGGVNSTGGGLFGSASTGRGPRTHANDEVAPPPLELRDERLKLLRLREDLVRKVRVPASAFEVKLMTTRIPGSEFETKRMIQRLRAEVAEEEAAKREASYSADVSGYLAPKDRASRDAALRQWRAALKQKRLRQGPRRMADGDRLAQILHLPPKPTIGQFIERALRALVPTANLRPQRKDPEPAEIEQKLKAGRCQIVVHVMKAENMPLRMDGTPCNVVADAFFVAHNAVSRPQDGPNPSWFQSLTLPFRPPDYDPATLSIIEDDIVVTFYDEVNVDIKPTEASTSYKDLKLVQFRQERRLLGSVRMPFYSVYQTEKASVEGQYMITTPRLIMNYIVPEHQPTANMYFSIWPPCIAPVQEPPSTRLLFEQVAQTFPTKELNVLYSAALQWKDRMDKEKSAVAKVNPAAEKRVFMPFVTNSNGDPCLITRYIVANGIRPPPSVTNAAQAIRFVSLFPFVVDLASGDDKDVWSSLSEFLDSGTGDYEELALLLLHLLRRVSNEPSFLVLGEGGVYTEATFVLTMANQNWVLVDPRTGDVFPVDDSRCGMVNVSMVVSHNQVWGNKQLSGEPYRMVWNLDDGRSWVPLFDGNHDAFLPLATTVQRPHLRVGDPATEELEVQVSVDVKRKVQNLIRGWRGDRSIRFDKGIAGHLAQVLMQLENERANFASFHQPAVESEQNTALNAIVGMDYTPVGYPVNCRFVRFSGALEDKSLENLYAAVRDTAVHEVGALNLSYAVATHVKGYTDKILSVWVYVVALIPKERL